MLAENSPQPLHEQVFCFSRFTTADFVIIADCPILKDKGKHQLLLHPIIVCRMLLNFLWLTLSELRNSFLWFQKDATAARMVRESIKLPREMFPWSLISLWGDLLFSARLSDVFAYDLFFGYLKPTNLWHRSLWQSVNWKLPSSTKLQLPQMTRRILWAGFKSV